MSSQWAQRQHSNWGKALSSCMQGGAVMPNKALQPTAPPPLRYGGSAAELGR